MPINVTGTIIVRVLFFTNVSKSKKKKLYWQKKYEKSGDFMTKSGDREKLPQIGRSPDNIGRVGQSVIGFTVQRPQTLTHFLI